MKCLLCPGIHKFKFLLSFLFVVKFLKSSSPLTFLGLLGPPSKTLSQYFQRSGAIQTKTKPPPPTNPDKRTWDRQRTDWALADTSTWCAQGAQFLVLSLLKITAAIPNKYKKQVWRAYSSL